MNNLSWTSTVQLGQVPDQNWQITGVADFSGDVDGDLLTYVEEWHLGSNSYDPTSGPNEDPDGDGINNLQECQTGTNPFAWNAPLDGLKVYTSLVK